jgi:hypothetical protein
MFIFTLKYHDTELYQRTAEIKAETVKEAQEKLKSLVPAANYIKVESIKEE